MTSFVKDPLNDEVVFTKEISSLCEACLDFFLKILVLLILLTVYFVYQQNKESSVP